MNHLSPKIAIALTGLLLAASFPSRLLAVNPTVNLLDPAQNTDVIGAVPGSKVTIRGVADDPAGNIVEHWLEVKRPAGDWSWQGWLTSEPWGPILGGTGSHSLKTVEFTVTDLGTYEFRTTAMDTNGDWQISASKYVRVVSKPSSFVPYSTNLAPPQKFYFQPGKTVTYAGWAAQNNYQIPGPITEHWLEVKRPAGDWSWQGWLTSEPWGPLLGGNSSNSEKSGNITLTDIGTYYFRTTMYVPSNSTWYISFETPVSISTAPTLYIYIGRPNGTTTVSLYASSSANNLLGFSAYLTDKNNSPLWLPSSLGDSAVQSIVYKTTSTSWPGAWPVTVHLTTTDSNGGAYNKVVTLGGTYYTIYTEPTLKYYTGFGL